MRFSNLFTKQAEGPANNEAQINEGKAYGPTGIAYSTDGAERMKKKSAADAVKQNKPLQKKLDKLYGPKKSAANTKGGTRRPFPGEYDYTMPSAAAVRDKKKSHAHPDSIKKSTSEAMSSKEKMKKGLYNSKLDPVGQEDGDVDNDGDKDSTDKYLLNRRKSIKKAMKGKKRETATMNPKMSTADKGSKDEMEQKESYQMKVKKMMANMMKSTDEATVNELSPDTMQRYSKLAKQDVKRRKAMDKIRGTGQTDPKIADRSAYRDLAKAKTKYKDAGRKGYDDYSPGSPKVEPAAQRRLNRSESTIRDKLLNVLEADRSAHYKSATAPEMMKDKLKGKGAQDMAKPAQDAIASPAADEIDMVNKDAGKMTANVKVSKKRNNDNDKGDKNIINKIVNAYQTMGSK